MNIVRLGPEYIPNPDATRALSNAYIYVGEPDTDPTVPANQKQISVLQENGTIVPVSQPLRTSIGGVPLYDGSPVSILVDGDYSLKILNSALAQKYYVPSVQSDSMTDTYSENMLGLVSRTGMTDGDRTFIAGFYTSAPQTSFLGSGLFIWQDNVSKASANGGTIIDPDNIGGFDGTSSTRNAFLTAQGSGVGSGCWVKVDTRMVSVADFGAVGNGVIDDAAAFNAAKGINRAIYLPPLTYNVLSGTFNTVDFYTDGSVSILVNTTIVARSMSDKSIRLWSPDASEIFEFSVNNNGSLELDPISSSFTPAPRFISNADISVKVTSDDTKIEPALYLKKDSTAGAVGMGLAKIQWRMTTDLGTTDVDGGRIDSVIIDPTEGSETCRMGLSTQVNGNSEAQACMSWQDGVMVPDGVTTIFPFGFGTLNVANALYNRNTKVVDSRVTGWTQATGTADRTTFNTTTVSLQELAERVKALIEDLYHHGLIGN